MNTSITDAELLELARHSFMRLDGAWFLAVAEKNGVSSAWELDVDAWKIFGYGFGKKLAQSHLPNPVWPDSFVKAQSIFASLMNFSGRRVETEGGRVTITVHDCETQKMIAKAGIADCGIATEATYQALTQGLFGRDKDCFVYHTKNLNQGEGYCEMVISDVELPDLQNQRPRRKQQ